MTTVLVLAVLAGCQQPLHQEQASMPPELAETLPEWAYDAPHYFRPPPEASPLAVNAADPDYPLHYYVRKPVILVTRPANNVPLDRAPRICVWWTNTNGCLWSRAGFFGLGQSHFAFLAGDDGDYGIRFVGSGITESLTQETIPHRIYHYDAVPPVVSITVEPDCTIYDPEEVLWVHWSVCDPNLDEMPVQLALCWSWENPDILKLREGELERPDAVDLEPSESRIWRPFQPIMEGEGMLAYAIPSFAAGEGFQFQVRAKDKAGNYGVGYSKVIMVSGHQELPESEQAEQVQEGPVNIQDDQEETVSASPIPEEISP
jgi:hypothetical protein